MRGIYRLFPLVLFLIIPVLTAGCGPAAGDKEEPSAEAAMEAEEEPAPEAVEETTEEETAEVAEETAQPKVTEEGAEEEPAEKTARPESVPSLYEWQQSLLSEPVSIDRLPLEMDITAPNSNNEGSMSFSLVWQFPESAWSVDPKDAALEVPPGSMKKASFSLSPATPSFPFPVPQLTAVVTSEGKELLSETKPLTVHHIRSARVCPARETPAIDGEIEPLWENGTKLSGFLLQDGSYLANPPTVVYVLYDESNLYFAFICYEADPGALKLQAERRDDPVWKDDSVEVFITSPVKPDIYYHFLVSAAGIMQDEIGDGKRWNGHWQAAASVDRQEKRWMAEIVVPASDLDVQSLADIPQIRANLTRNRYAGKAQFSMWNCTFGSSHKPELFGRLLLKQR